MSSEKKKIINFIDNNMKHLSKNYKIQILKLLIDCNIRNKQTGTGIVVDYDDIDNETLFEIYQIIKHAINQPVLFEKSV